MPGSQIGAIIAVLVVCAAVAAFLVRLATGHGGQPRPLSTMLASQQPVGLAGTGPQPGSSPQLLLAPNSNGGLAFLASGPDSAVQANEQWQADQMTDRSYVLVYVPNGKCLGAATSPGGTAQPRLQSCDLQLGQRWTHPYLGKNPGGQDYWHLRSMATGQCLAATGGNWGNGAAAGLRPCGKSFPWQQFIAFWSAY